MMPSRRRTDGSRGLLLPNHLMPPLVGVAAVASMRSRVVLPDPFGPIKPRISPGANFRLTSKTPLPPRYRRLSPLAASRLGSEAVASFMKVTGFDPLLDHRIHHPARHAVLPELAGVAFDGLHDLPLDERRHVLQSGGGRIVPRQAWALLLQGIGDLAPHLELHVHDVRRDHAAESLLGGRPFDAPAAELAAVRGQLVEPRLRLLGPGEAVLEGFRAQRVPVADLDAEPLQERGIDRDRK